MVRLEPTLIGSTVMKLHNLVVLFSFCLVLQNLGWCRCLNDEGLALLKFRGKVVSDPFGALSNWEDDDACLWSGIQCSDGGKVVALNLKDLCLRGTLSPELKGLTHIKSIILRNNSFSGIIPEALGELKELEVLDVGGNNFVGPLPHSLNNSQTLAILLLDNNGNFGNLSPQTYGPGKPFVYKDNGNQLHSGANGFSCKERYNSWYVRPIQSESVPDKSIRTANQAEEGVQRRLLQAAASPSSNAQNEETRPPPTFRRIPFFNPYITNSSPPSPHSHSHSKAHPASRPSPSVEAPSSVPPSTQEQSSPRTISPSPPNQFFQQPPPFQIPRASSRRSNTNRRLIARLVGPIGGAVFLLILLLGIYLCRAKMATVRPWASGLSGQLQKAFVNGIPKLKRSELQTACEDFSNVIGSSPIGTMYKGTLSNGVEIAVISVNVTLSKDWSKNLEAQFRKKIETLSKVNHKNFINLLGYCVEKDPFTRMMVFEYAPNGTLFEHLHFQEAEHLDWASRIRIAVGVAYCLDHMHQLNPPIGHSCLNSSSIYLSEDYAAKISEFGFWNEVAELRTKSQTGLAKLESNVYSFGVILYEIVTGRLPHPLHDAPLESRASDFSRGDQPLKEIMDPTLDSYDEGQVEMLDEVIRSCIHPDPNQRPPMKEVAERLKEITSITPQGANPRLSPLWWAELEVASTEADAS